MDINFLLPGSGCLILSLILSGHYLLPPFKRGSIKVRIVLFVFRFVSVMVICLLLLPFFYNRRVSVTTPPLIVIAQDNSKSVAARTGMNNGEYVKVMKKLISSLERRFRVKLLSFGSSVSSGINFKFDEQASDLFALLDRVQRSEYDSNIGAIVLASDGIFNRGGNPLARPDKAPVYTILMGDNKPTQDLALVSLRYSDKVPVGSFDLEVGIEARRARGVASKLVVERDGKAIFSKEIIFKSDNYTLSLPVRLAAKTVGFQHLSVTLVPLKNEINKSNNRRDAIVEVVKGGMRVLVSAAAPHPDIGVIKNALLTIKGTKVDLVFSGDLPPEEGYDLIIAHDYPALGSKVAFNPFDFKKTPVWFIFAGQVDVTAFNRAQKEVKLLSSEEEDRSINLNPKFKLFSLPDSVKRDVSKFAQVAVPRFETQPADALLDAGQVQHTPKPLLFFFTQAGVKEAFWMGSGLWRSQLQSSKLKGLTALINATALYLTAQSKKEQFEVSMLENVLSESESPEIHARLLNAQDKPVNSPDASLVLTDSKGKQTIQKFERSEDSYILKLAPLPADRYTFKATVKFGKVLTALGAFSVTATSNELENLQANHELLTQLSQRSGGLAFQPAELEQLPAFIEHNVKIRNKVTVKETKEGLIHSKLLFFLIAATLTAEWFIRKWNGYV